MQILNLDHFGQTEPLSGHQNELNKILLLPVGNAKKMQAKYMGCKKEQWTQNFVLSFQGSKMYKLRP